MAKSPGAPRARRTPLQALFYWTLVLGVWGVIFVVGFLAVFATDLPDTSKLYDVKRQPSISYLDRSGALVAVRGSQESPPVDLDQLPPYVPAAFVAIEDRQFYHHFGFNPWGMARAELYNLTHRGSTLQGGSTITQQLARNLFLSPAQNIRRKAQELILAVWLETKFSKKQILALYLNRVNFGGGAYGIEAASQRYFNKPAAQLTLGEAALLAATMKGPSRYNPAANGERAAKRATQVLNAMVETGAITPAERDQAFAPPVRVSATLASQRAQYFTDWLDSSGAVASWARSRPRTWWSRPRSTCRSRRRPNWRCAPASPATRRRGCSRARWWRWTARAASAPTSAASPTPTASSTAPPRRSARPARRSSRSST